MCSEEHSRRPVLVCSEEQARRPVLLCCQDPYRWGLRDKAGFGVSEVILGLTLGFQSHGGSLFNGVDRHAAHLTCSGEGYVRDDR